MPLTFVLINADLGTEEEIVKELRKIEEVKEAYFVYGPYDILVKVKADKLDRVKEVISSTIRRLDHVRSTLTMIAVEGTSGSLQ